LVAQRRLDSFQGLRTINSGDNRGYGYHAAPSWYVLLLGGNDVGCPCPGLLR
jgi:hypothetical protein